MNSKLIVQECSDRARIEDMWKDQNHNGITINHICKLGKEKKFTFEDDIPNIKTDTNQNLLTQILEIAIVWNNLSKQ